MNPVLRHAKSMLKEKAPFIFHQLKRANNLRYLNKTSSSEKISYYGRDLLIPSDHKLLSVVTTQPLRHRGLQSAAAAIFRKHPGSTYLDIGANIGDTAAVVRSVSDCLMVLIEPSPVFYPLLVRNAPTIGGKIETLNSFFVTLEDKDQGFELMHSAGTALAHRVRKGNATPNLSLDDLSPKGRIGLFKTNTDTYDLPFLEGYGDKFGAEAINLFFAVKVQSSGDVERWLACMQNLLSKGYSEFLVWDDPGHLICSVTSLDLMGQLLKWQQLYMDGSSQEIPRIENFDVLALHRDDLDLMPEIIQRSGSR